MLVVSGLLLHVCIAAMVLKPNTQQPLGHIQKKCEDEENVEMTDAPNEKIQEELSENRLDIRSSQEEGMLQIPKDLFCDIRFHILSLLTLLFMAGSSTTYSYLHGYAQFMGVEEYKADLLVSLVGGFALGGSCVVPVELFDLS